MRLALLLCLLALVGGAFAADAPTKPPASSPAEQTKATEVWITSTGKKYHRASCRYAKIKSTLEQAQARGLTPCKVCNP
jgi:DNA-entry nuclease